MGISASLAKYYKIILQKHENVPNTLMTKQKKPGDIPNGPLCPLCQLFHSQQNFYQNIDNNKKYDSLLKIFRSLKK